ncbi:TonB-linked outer membrane protein, SusC/RagA family [Sphingobacterium nematocida]|uniref:TonB-linked outer membrane protein, SusC/RagA family n=2 Tax=Sphingobacterium nematocida TaxID=1513896 RepID=A0A1T5EX00_9SPHI|nr:TonB-linked outer membrane protein, SusC/RagA family [Sphingobacterium nematocida]
MNYTSVCKEAYIPLVVYKFHFDRRFLRTLILMKIFVTLLLALSLQVSAKISAQTVNLTLKKTLLSTAMERISKQTRYDFSYNAEILDIAQPVNITIRNASIEHALEQLFSKQPLTYEIVDRIILVRKKPIALSDKRNIDPAAAQQSITGQVTNERAEPIMGVSVKVKGTSAGTLTDENGRFTLKVDPSSTLVFSSVGFKPQEAKVSGNSMAIVLIQENDELDEVVVVGYGVQKKVNLTGSVSSVKGDEIAKRPVAQVSSALQGLVPGLTVRQQSGQPGRDGGNLLIRGVGTLGSGMGPLVLVDGVESTMNNVDANDIENISVLKDAASAAIYGSRAAGGVILITTKRANKPGAMVEYSSYAGWQVPTDNTSMVGAIDHMTMINEAYTNTGRDPLYTQKVIDEYIAGISTNPDRYPDTDWRALTMRSNGFMHNHHIGISSSSEKVKVLGSINYIDQDGILDNTNFKRYNMRLNTDITLNDKWSAAMDLLLVRKNLIEPSSSTSSVFHWMRRIPANQPGIFSNGQYGEGWNGDNPIAKARDGGLNKVNPFNSIINLDLKYQPVEWLKFNLVYSPKFEISHNKSFAEIIQTYNWDGTKSFAKPARNSLKESFSQYWYNNLRAMATFDKRIAADHQLTILAGFQQEDQVDHTLSAFREVFLLPQFQEIDAGNKENERTGGNSTHWSLRSLFGRINYNYKEKYLFEANARYDGSSRFGKGNKYSFFPSFSAGWRLSQESFMQDILPTINDMKLRASWGKLGNQDIGLYPFAAFVTIGDNNYVFDDRIYTGAALLTMANPEIKWETTTVTDIGVDLQLWKSFSLTADYFYRKTTDILLQLDIPKTNGLGAPYQNAGVMENKGWEVSLGYRNQVNSFKYGVTVNLSDVKNKVLDMRGVQRTGLQVNHEGYPMNSLYGYEAEGYFKDAADIADHAKQFGTVAPGDIKYKDQNGDGKIDNQDEIIMGSHLPRYTYSTNIDLGYKGFDLSLFLQGVGKASGYLYGQGIMPFYEGGTVQEQHKDRWTPENTNSNFPRFAFNEINNIQNSTFWMKSAAYLRLKNVQLSYTVPLSPRMQENIKALRIYVSGQNLFTHNKFWEGYDPEGPVGDGSWYPQMKVYSVGLNVKL